MDSACIPENNTMNLFETHPLHLYVITPSLRRESALLRVCELYKWKDVLQFCNILTTVCTNDEISVLSAMKSTLFPEFHVFADSGLEAARKLHCLHEKPVFGRHEHVIHPSLFLVDHGRIAASARQIRQASIIRIVEKALRMQTRWVCSSMKNLIDKKILP